MGSIPVRKARSKELEILLEAGVVGDDSSSEVPPTKTRSVSILSLFTLCVVFFTGLGTFSYGSKLTTLYESALSKNMFSVYTSTQFAAAASDATSHPDVHHILNPNANNNNNNNKPTCKELMNGNSNSPYRDGEFLTRHTQQIFWHPLADGSRRLEHSLCVLHRYTAPEARACLNGKHINYIGDSLTRYQFMSLAYFLHKGKYPPRWERPDPPTADCHHFNEIGQPTCSPPTEPNICHYKDWAKDPPPGQTGWTAYDLGVGSKKIFNGSMEANAIRTDAMNPRIETYTENYMYVSPLGSKSNNEAPTKHIILTFLLEIGWEGVTGITPIHGWNWTYCAFDQNCTYSESRVVQLEKRALEMDFDFSQPLEQAIDIRNATSILGKLIPPVDIVVYNRGIWGPLNEQRTQKLMPLFKQYVSTVPGTGGWKRGKCFYQSSTSGYGGMGPTAFKGMHDLEIDMVRREARKANCGFIDLGHLVDDFNQLHMGSHEHGSVYVDNVHFRPWVYEEINNIWLNQMCNVP